MPRPKKIIDYVVVKDMAEKFCTQAEIADRLGLSVRTLQRDVEFCRVFKNGLNVSKESLRAKQFQIALKGNTTMLIWLGKNYLYQREDPDAIIAKSELIKLSNEKSDEEKIEEVMGFYLDSIIGDITAKNIIDMIKSKSSTKDKKEYNPIINISIDKDDINL